MSSRPDAELSCAVSVVIPARNAAATIGRTLETLRAQSLREPFEVIVVDNGSTDGTQEIVAGFAPFARLERNDPPGGPGSARNRGVAISRGEVIAFTDADCFPTPQWLERGLAALGERGILQGGVRPDASARRSPFDRSLDVGHENGLYQTANLFVRRAVFTAVGGFNDWTLAGEQTGGVAARRHRRLLRRPIGEDVQFAWEALRTGVSAGFAAEALVEHAVFPGSLGAAVRERWHWSQEMPGLARRVPELRRAAFYRRFFFAGWTAQFDLALAGIAAALVTRQRRWLGLLAPYARRVATEARSLHSDDGVRPSAARARVRFIFGMPLVDGATVLGLVIGSLRSKTPVL